MNKKETVLLLQQIDLYFPGRIKVNEQMIEAWHDIFTDQEFDRVMWRLTNYSKSNKFPPTIADLYEEKRPEHNKDYLSKIDEWERNASGKPRS